jgi:uncharacterized alkaline shock family protein YloU
VAVRVVERIAAHVAATVPGVGTADHLPRAQATLSQGAPTTTGSGHATLSVDVAVIWPEPAAEVAARVRHAVATTVEGLTPFTVDRVDVRVRSIVSDTTPERVQ